MTDQPQREINQEAGLTGGGGAGRLLAFRPPRIAMALMLAAIALHLLSPAGTVLFLPHRLLGAVALAAGFALMMWAWVLFNTGKTAVCHTGTATSLIERAPYSFSRNPMYLGMVLMLSGGAILLGSAIALAAPVTFFFIINEFYIPFEERNMERIFGGRYVDYRRRVRRWL